MSPGLEPPVVTQARAGRGRVMLLGSLGWLVAPAVSTVVHHDPARAAAALAAAAAFVAVYVRAVLPATPGPLRGRSPGTVLAEVTRPGGEAAVALLAALVGVAMALGGASRWAGALTFAAVVAGWRLPWGRSLAAIAILAVAGGAGDAAGGDSTGAAVGLALTTVSVGLLLGGFRRLVEARAELDAARQEIARLAVADERLRFARDLHDLLGHSLSVIALKSELAGRLLPAQAQRAGEQVADIEAVSRRALAEVRETVSGYRQPTLAAELEGARTALDAAGIEVRSNAPPAALPSDAEAVLAWAVREGTTNVLRHSGARRCSIRLLAGPEAASVEVLDDGVGGHVDGTGTGTGLAGLGERVARLRGRLEAEPRAGGGFRLEVSVPLAEAA